MKTSKADTWFSRFIRLRDATESNEKALLSVASLKSTKDEYSTTDNRST